MIVRMLLLLVLPVFLQAQTADEIIKKVQANFNKIETIKADFTQTIFTNNAAKPFSFSGKFYFKKQNKFVIVLPSREIISDGKTIWNYDKKGNKVIISDYDENSVAFSLNKIIYVYPSKCNLTLVNKGVKGYGIKATPINSELNFKEALLFVNKKFILNKVEITDYNGMQYSFELFSIKINPPIKNETFNFSPPNTVEVIDLR